MHLNSVKRRVRRFLNLSKSAGFSWAAGKATRELERLGRRVGRGSSYPHKVQLELASFCNMDCSYCALRDRMPERKLLRPQVFDRLRPAFRYLRSIQLSGLAEPLVNKNFVDYVRAVKAESNGCHTETFSNLTLLTENVARQLIESGLDSLIFSLDGVDHELINSVRLGGRNEKVVENITMLQELKKQLGSRTPVVGATIVLQKTNYHQFPLVVEALAGLGIPNLGVNGMDPFYQQLVEEVLWNPALAPDDLPVVLEHGLRRAAELGVDVILPAFRPQSPVCKEVHTPIVMANGDVVPCSLMAYRRDSLLTVSNDLEIEFNPGANPTLVFGNILEQGLDEIWQKPDYVAFRNSVVSGDFPDTCNRCNLKHNCICPQDRLTPGELLGEMRQRSRIPAQGCNTGASANLP